MAENTEPKIEEIKTPGAEETETIDDIRKDFANTLAQEPPASEIPVAIKPEPEENPAEVAKWERTILYNTLRGIEWLYSGAHAFGYNTINSGESKVEHEKIRLDPSDVEKTIDEMPRSVQKWFLENIPWYVGTVIRIEQSYVAKIAEHSQPIEKKEKDKNEGTETKK